MMVMMVVVVMMMMVVPIAIMVVVVMMVHHLLGIGAACQRQHQKGSRQGGCSQEFPQHFKLQCLAPTGARERHLIPVLLYAK
jgi:hypothetical protein